MDGESLQASHDPADPAKSLPACPVCASSDTLFFARRDDRLFGLAPGFYTLRRCRDCRCIFQDPIPDGESLAGAYPKDYWWADNTGSGRGVARVLVMLERAYREQVVTFDHVRFLQHCAMVAGCKGRSLLDIGCGSGTFLHAARSKGFEPHGMDQSDRAVTIARKLYALEVRQGEIGSGVWNGSRFDFVTMFHVLEHLADPGAALTYAATLLKPGGSLILQVPNAASLQARVFRGRWYGLDVPRHVINFAPRSLDHLLTRSDFRSRSIARFSLRDSPASLASSICPRLDPIGRRGSGRASRGHVEMTLAFAYLGLVLFSLPFALVESALGYGSTLWVHATR